MPESLFNMRNEKGQTFVWPFFISSGRDYFFDFFFLAAAFFLGAAAFLSARALDFSSAFALLACFLAAFAAFSASLFTAFFLGEVRLGAAAFLAGLALVTSVSSSWLGGVSSSAISYRFVSRYLSIFTDVKALQYQ